ncbi:MAG: ribosome biogenesis factor YjgA [Bilophila sp.]
MPIKKRYQWNPQGEEAGDERPSRSQKKRDSTALQNMGEELSALSPSVLAKMPVTQSIRDAVREWQKVASHEGRRRQMQYIGRLMREEADETAVREALDALKAGQTIETASFKHLEKLRDELMLATPAETVTLLAAFSVENQGEVRDLVAKARNEREHGRPPHAFRALFRKLKTLAEAPQPEHAAQ